MTNDILQSDIDLVRKLLAANSPDAEIVAALTRRGIELTRAARLVADLRDGRRVTPPMWPGSELRRAPNSPGSGAAQARQPQTASLTSPERSRRRRSARSTPQRRSPSAVLWTIVFILLAIGAVAVGLVVANRLRHDREKRAPAAAGSSKNTLAGKPTAALDKPKPGLPLRQSTNPPAHPTIPSAPSPALVLEIRPNGLHVCGSLITGDNALKTLSQILGAPTRTNQPAAPEPHTAATLPSPSPGAPVWTNLAAQTEQVIYAYDRHGLLLYSHKGAGDDCLVLDCDALGGANGTDSPFSGTLKVEDEVIGPETDAETLAAFKKLGLSNSTATDHSFFDARCHRLKLYFAYLNTRHRLSLIQINLNPSADTP